MDNDFEPFSCEEHSTEDLKKLLEMFEKSILHLQDILQKDDEAKVKNEKTLDSHNRLGMELHLKYTSLDMKTIQEEITKRENGNK